MMKYKKAMNQAEAAGQVACDNPDATDEEKVELVRIKCASLKENGLLIDQWDLDFLEADLQWCGRDGSPTKVHRIQSVVLQAKDSKDVEPTQDRVNEMIHELIQEHTIG